MSKLFVPMFFVGLLLAACNNDKKPALQASDAAAAGAKTGTAFAVDTVQSEIKWEGYEGLALGNPEHNGTLAISTGTLLVNAGKIVGGSFTIPFASLQVKDIPATEPRNAKLRGHLLNADFFDVEKFPTAGFEITNVAAANNDSVAITGNLTLKGITKSVTIPAAVTVNEDNVSATTPKFYINRKDWGINYRSENSLGDELIRPEMGLSIQLVAKKQ